MPRPIFYPVLLFSLSFPPSPFSFVSPSFSPPSSPSFLPPSPPLRPASVEAIYLIPQSPAPGLSIVKALKDQNITAKLLTAEVLMGDEIVKENQKILEGVIGFDQAFDDTTEAFKRFTQAYKTANNNEELSYPFYQTALYSEVYLAKELLEKEGNDGEKMQNALSRLSNWNGSVLPNVTLDANGDILWSSFNVKNVRSGKAEKVKVSISSYKRGWCFWQLLEYPDPGSLTP